MLKLAVLAAALIAAEGAGETSADDGDSVRDAAEAIRIARTTCGKDSPLQDEKLWGAKREGDIWFVWAPNIKGYTPEDFSQFGSVAAYINAKDGSLAKCTVEVQVDE